MYTGKCLTIGVLLLALLGCSTTEVDAQQNGRASAAASPRSVSDLMRYSVAVQSYSESEYEAALSAARTQYEISGSAANKIRLAATLMHAGASNAASNYREAEALLKEYLNKDHIGFFEEDYRNFATFLLSINEAWLRKHNQLIAARVESADALKKLEELKSIEMRLNHRENRF